jgi:protease II
MGRSAGLNAYMESLIGDLRRLKVNFLAQSHPHPVQHDFSLVKHDISKQSKVGSNQWHNYVIKFHKAEKGNGLTVPPSETLFNLNRTAPTSKYRLLHFSCHVIQPL